MDIIIAGVRRIVAAMGMAACCLPPAAAYAATGDADDAHLGGFLYAVERYVELHRAIRSTLSPMETSADPGTIQHQRDAFAVALRTARADAREGDVFDRRAAFTLKRRIHAAMGERGPALVARAISDWPSRDRSIAVVNDRMPWSAGSFMPISVVLVLPPLPAELQYRFVGRDLVLVDVDAGLVVDVMRNLLEPVRAA